MDDDALAAAGSAGQVPRAVEETLARLPGKPGCYLFKDASGTVLYVGKAESLRNRVRSYFHKPEGLGPIKRRLVASIASIDYQVVTSDTEALLLEYNLIKQHNPKYNMRLKDDKSFLSIRITREPYPRIETVRRRSDDGARYFGPYASAQSVHRTLDLLKRLFPYRSCRLNIIPPSTGAPVADEAPAGTAARRAGRRAPEKSHAGREGGDERRPPQERITTVASPQNRACLEYHIHRCAGPCIDAVSQQDYAAIIEQAALFLQGRAERVLAQLQRDMEQAAEDLHFERAAELRNQIAAVQRIVERQRVTVHDGHDQDIVGLARAEDEACIELIRVREGRMLGHQQFVIQGSADQDDGAVLGAFLTQYYVLSSELPDEVLLPSEPEDGEAIAALLVAKKGRKVALTTPKRGDKVALLAIAAQNAAEAAEQRRVRAQGDSQKIRQALHDLQAYLQLPRLPLRIECFDISTIQGTSTVGSMVVFEQGKPKTAAYRRFQIKTVTGTDDFASMAEMVRRRLKRAGAAGGDAEAAADTADLVEAVIEPEGPNAGNMAERHDDGGTPSGGDTPHMGDQTPAAEWARRPDLMIIDGGKGQLGAVLAVLEELGITGQPIVSLAKQREELFLPGRQDPILLPANSQALFLVQRIRDEAHRFAVTYHRNVRGRRSLESSLDSVPGVGPARKKDLIRHFGSVKALRRADLAAIAAVPGIGHKTALAIKEHLGEA